ncbi:MAG: SseB family protein [Paracoccaceae bacterium]
MTELDHAYEAMVAAPDGDDAPRLRYYAALADGEMILVLETEAAAGNVTPKVFDLDEGPVVLCFDSEEKLGAFAAGTVPYAALPGRVIAQQLAGQGIGLAVNLGAASMMLFPADAVDWLAETLAQDVDEAEAMPVAFGAPSGIPAGFLEVLRAKLARARGRAGMAVLSAVTYADGRRGHVLALTDAQTGTEAGLARAVNEALIFSGIDAAEIDVVFLSAADARVGLMQVQGLVLDMTAPAPAAAAAPKPPGSDPDRPPKLR